MTTLVRRRVAKIASRPSVYSQADLDAARRAAEQLGYGIGLARAGDAACSRRVMTSSRPGSDVSLMAGSAKSFSTRRRPPPSERSRPMPQSLPRWLSNTVPRWKRCAMRLQTAVRAPWVRRWR